MAWLLDSPHWRDHHWQARIDFHVLVRLHLFWLQTQHEVELILRIRPWIVGLVDQTFRGDACQIFGRDSLPPGSKVSRISNACGFVEANQDSVSSVRWLKDEKSMFGCFSARGGQHWTSAKR